MNSEYVIWHRGEVKQLSKHFTSSEFSCPCSHRTCTLQKISAVLVENLETIRQSLGVPMKITSGYRCPAYQAELKARGYETATGVSQHELGNAADVRCPEKHTELVSLCEGLFDAVGVARSFVHVDTRAGKRRWTYGVRQ